MSRFSILALSGGGYKGLYSIKVLEKLESQYGYPIADKFDLISGTSIGGILALALASDIETKEIVDFFYTQGEIIFPKTIPFIKNHTFGLFKPKYNNTGLRKSLIKIFGDKTMGDLKHRTIVPAINYTKGSPQLMKTRHHESFVFDSKKKLVDVALATSAAPTYFPIYRTEYGDFVDGGLVANHPGLFALIEATQFLSILDTDIQMLHVGTLSQKSTSNAALNLGLLGWNRNLLNLIFSCQEKSTDQILSFLLESRYKSIDEIITEKQSKKIKLDVVNKKAKTILCQIAEESAKQYINTSHCRMIFEHQAERFTPMP